MRDGFLVPQRASFDRIVMTALMTLGLVLGAIALPGNAATATTNRANAAGLIVDYGNDAYTYAWVPFDQPKINGVELLQASGLPVLTVGFGGLGDAVCRIEKVGCDVSACRARLCQTASADSPFWHYYRLGAGNTWTLQALGGSASPVVDGDVDAWVWTGAAAPTDLPAMTLEAIAARTGAEPGGSTPKVVTTGLTEAAAATSSTAGYAGAAAIIVALCLAGGYARLRTRGRSRPVPR